LISKNQNNYFSGQPNQGNIFALIRGGYKETYWPIAASAKILITTCKDSNQFYSINSFEIKKSRDLNLCMHLRRLKGKT
jgi:hypothetical protein